MPTQIVLILCVLPVLVSSIGLSGVCKPLDILLTNVQEGLLSDRIPLSLPQSLILEDAVLGRGYRDQSLPILPLEVRVPRGLPKRGYRDQSLNSRLEEASSSFTPDHSANVSVRLLRQLYKPSENLVFSPYSIMTALMMLLLGSSGQSRLQLLETLFGSTNDSFVQQFTSDYAQLREINSEQLKMGNFIYPDTSLHCDALNSQFTERLTRDFAAIVKEVSFANEASTLQTINADARKATQGMIDQLFEQLDPNTVLLLVNTVLFKGLWAVPFMEEYTDLSGTFYPSSGEEVKVPMMKQIAKLSYFEKSGTKAVLVPYKDSGIRMLLLLPPEDTPIDVFVNQINGTFLDNILKDLIGSRLSNLHLFMPRFKLSSTHEELVSVLHNLGVTNIFVPSKDNLCGLAVSEICQKATIEVNEKGTQATAATAIGFIRSIHLSFNANRPFVYALLRLPKLGGHKQILFMGVLHDPSKE